METLATPNRDGMGLEGAGGRGRTAVGGVSVAPREVA